MAGTFSVLLLTAPPPGMGSEGNGAFVKIDGREAILRSAELFLNRENITQVQVVISPDGFEEAKRKFGGHFGFTGVKLLSGGPGWMKQVAAGAKALPPDATHIVVHDAARPAVSYADIDALLESAEKHPAVVMTAPLKSAIVELDEGGGALAFQPANRYAQLVTPQAFSRERFLKMAESQSEAHASEVSLLPGSALNVRIGTAGEAALLKSMIGMLPKPKVKPPSSPFEEAQW
jgi:2-C-methyl-D-erythritol 4-phosphate cytidylyltransferase